MRKSEADVELADGQRTTASIVLTPEVSVGDYVLLDRGFVIQTISADEAQTIMALYDEMSSLAELP
jgi:hydrogenase expression/formation protein HypC